MKEIESQIDADDTSERQLSAINNISSKLTEDITELGVEFSEFSFRFDLSKITGVADRPEQPVPMIRILTIW